MTEIWAAGFVIGEHSSSVGVGESRGEQQPVVVWNFSAGGSVCVRARMDLVIAVNWEVDYGEVAGDCGVG